jgi:hypothetical protein
MLNLTIFKEIFDIYIIKLSEFGRTKWRLNFDNRMKSNFDQSEFHF